MGKYLGKTWDEWNQLGAENTVLSILSQPKAWEDTLNAIEEQKHISKLSLNFSCGYHDDGTYIRVRFDWCFFRSFF